MSDLNKKFETAQADVKKLTKRPDDEDMLRLYAHFKQATAGDVRASARAPSDFVDRAKYDAWAKLKGTDSTRRRKTTSSWSSA